MFPICLYLSECRGGARLFSVCALLWNLPCGGCCLATQSLPKAHVIHPLFKKGTTESTSNHSSGLVLFRAKMNLDCIYYPSLLINNTEENLLWLPINNLFNFPILHIEYFSAGMRFFPTNPMVMTSLSNSLK